MKQQSLVYLPPGKRFKTHKPKKWFNKSCSKARVLFKQAANKANKYPSETQLNEDKITKLKEFKRSVKANKRNFGIIEQES